MSWRVAVTHVTGYRYDTDVRASYNEARVTPLTVDGQVVRESRVSTDPPTRQQAYVDYWGTRVTAFDLHQAHDHLQVTATSVVETADARQPRQDVTWQEVAAADLGEHLALTPRTTPDAQMAGRARELAAGRSPYDVVVALCEEVRARVAYVPGATGVRTEAAEAWRQGAGVCQDLAHVLLALLRTAGVPARYVSGYLAPRPDAAIGEPVAGESHAWVEVWLGDWWGTDPTNGVPAGERHVLVARGRDYDDVTPLKGIYSGGGSHRLGVTVEVTRLA